MLEEQAPYHVERSLPWFSIISLFASGLKRTLV